VDEGASNGIDGLLAIPTDEDGDIVLTGRSVMGAGVCAQLELATAKLALENVAASKVEVASTQMV